MHSSIEDLKIAMGALAGAFLLKGEEFSQHLKMGRTQLQDAVPMTLGQEFTAFAHTMFLGLITSRALVFIGAATMVVSLYSWLTAPLEPEHH